MKRILFLLFIVTACATPLKQQFGKVELGMDKSEVIDEVGSPNRSFRSNDQDIWIYQFYDDQELHVREISFKDGVVNYVGDERDRQSKPTTVKSPDEAASKLKNELKPSKKSHDFKDVKEDGSY